MKKFIFIMMLMLAMHIDMSAQEHAVSGTRFVDNTYVSVLGGATVPMDFDESFPMNVNAGLKVGKWVTPVLGFNVEGLAVFGDNHFAMSNTFVKAVNVGLNANVNLCNWLGGYKANRLCNASLGGGLGWLHQFPSHTNDMTAKTGIVVDFSLNKTHNWHLYAEPCIYWNLTGGINNDIKFNRNHAQLGLQVGVAYRFRTSNGTRNFMKYDMTELNASIARLEQENIDLRNREAEVVEKVVERIVTVSPTSTASTVQVIPVDRNTVVMFGCNSSELTDNAKKQLDNVSVSKVSIVAYSSPEGNARYNQLLSERRANAVAEYLRGRNVEVVSAQGLGATDSASNRVAIVTVVE